LAGPVSVPNPNPFATLEGRLVGHPPAATICGVDTPLEDLEDLRDLEQSITENAGKPLIPWDQVKAEPGLD
jgi:hypothetical protein